MPRAPGNGPHTKDFPHGRNKKRSRKAPQKASPSPESNPAREQTAGAAAQSPAEAAAQPSVFNPAASAPEARKKPFVLPVNAAFLKDALRFMAGLPEILLPDGLAANTPQTAPKVATDQAITVALAGIGKLLGVSRAYLMLDEEDGRYLRNSHEWVDGKIGPAMYSWPLHDYEKDLPSLKGLMAGKDFYAAHTRDTPPDLHRVLAMQAVDSVLLVPLTQNGVWIGLMGFDVCEQERDWREEEIALLRHLARLAAVALERRGHLAAQVRLARARAVLCEEEASERGLVPPVPENAQSLQTAERSIIVETLNIYQGNRLRAAKHLGLTWAQLDRRCKKLGITMKR